jgi:hypothetical protein
MDRLDPRGRAMLRAYRSAKVSPPGQREELWTRIETSLDAGARGPTLEPASAPASAPAWAWPVVAVAVAVAAIVIAVLALRPAGDPEHELRRTPAGAPYDAMPVEPEVAVPADGSTVARSQAGAAGPVEGSAAAKAGSAASVTASESTAERAPAGPRRGSLRHGDRLPTPASDDAPVSEVDELRAEMALIREARQALHAQRPAGALEVLDAHARAFPAGQMREDREVLRIEALCAAGKAPQARAEVRLFLRAFPGSAHAQRVRSMCAEP